MKKLLVFSLAAMLVVAFCIPASALENVFGGYWRTRMVTRQDFDGDDAGTLDEGKVDTRTRLYYTAILNENLKFVNKFEFDAHWGKGGAGNDGLNTYGDFGADGQNVEIKESYVNFTIAPIEVRMGVFDHTFGRSLIFDDEAAGVEIKFKNDMMTIPIHWFKGYEGYVDSGIHDVDVFAFNPVFTVAESWGINPFVVWLYSEDISQAVAAGNASFKQAPAGEKASVYWLGVNVDGSIGPAGIWFTGIYQTGSIDDVAVVGDVDVSAFVVAGGGSVALGPATLHTQAFYASGDDDAADDDIEAFLGLSGQSYYWSEIMGYGIFDWYVPTGSPADAISNIWAANLGASIKPFDKLTITGDVWYAQLVEENVFDEDELGIEVDLKLTYQLMEGMNVDLVGAYLFAGDATSSDGDNDENPYEIGTRFSISF